MFSSGHTQRTSGYFRSTESGCNAHFWLSRGKSKKTVTAGRMAESFSIRAPECPDNQRSSSFMLETTPNPPVVERTTVVTPNPCRLWTLTILSLCLNGLVLLLLLIGLICHHHHHKHHGFGDRHERG